jgi:hypothetical protein
MYGVKYTDIQIRHLLCVHGPRTSLSVQQGIASYVEQLNKEGNR